MGKTLELAFALAGKLMPSFANATKDASAQLGKVGKEMKQISAAAQKRQDATAFKNLGKSAKDASAAFRSLGSEITGTMKIISGTTLAVGGAIWGVAKSSADYADNAIKTAQGLGMTTEAYTELAYAAKQCGVNQQLFTMSTSKVNKAYKDALGGNKKAVELFQRAGVSLQNQNGTLKTSEQLYGELADAFAAMPEGIGKSALALDFFGEQGSKLVPFLNSGKKGLEILRSEARRLNITISDLDAKNAERFNDTFANIGDSIRGATLVIGKELWPALADGHEHVSKWISANASLLAQDLPGWIEDIKNEWIVLEPQLKAGWEDIKSGARYFNSMAQSMGGWIPVIKSAAKYWLYWRGLRIGLSLYKTGAGVVKVGKDFATAIPAMKRWIKNFKESSLLVRGTKRVFGGIKSAAAGTKSIFVELKKWGFTLRVVGSTMKNYAKGTASSLLSMGKTAGGKAVAGLKTFAAAAISGIVTAARFSATLAVKAASSIASFGASLLTGAVAGLKAFAAAMWPAIVAAVKFSAALLANPIGLVIIGITAAVAAAIWLYKNWDQVVAWLGKAWNWMKDTAKAAFDAVAGVASAAWEMVKPIFTAGWALLPGWLQGYLSTMYANTVAGFKIIYGAFKSAWDAVSGFFGKKIDNVKAAFDKGFLQGIASLIREFSLIGLFADMINGAIDYIKGIDIAAAGKALIDNFANGILSAWESVKDTVAQKVTDWIPGGQHIVNAASTASGYVKSGASAIGSAAGAVGSGLSGAYNAVSGWFANGGIVSTPQLAMVGEAGPEVIVPINRPARANSLMDAAESMLGASRNGGGAGTTISVNFSPTIHITGGESGDGIVGKIQRALKSEELNLRKMIEDIVSNNRRVAWR